MEELVSGFSTTDSAAHRQTAARHLEELLKVEDAPQLSAALPETHG